MKKIDHKDLVPVSLKAPRALVEEIDLICKTNFLSRASWFLQAAKQVLEKDRKEGAHEIIENLLKEKST